MSIRINHLLNAKSLGIEGMRWSKEQIYPQEDTKYEKREWLVEGEFEIS